jgi:hypothetical protein
MASGGSRRGDQYISEAGVFTWGCGDAKWTFVALSLHGPFSTPHHPSGRDDKAAHLAPPAGVITTTATIAFTEQAIALELPIITSTSGPLTPVTFTSAPLRPPYRSRLLDCTSVSR